ncbi:MAG: hypothetical protein ACLR6T_02060 [Intestinibacter sp.]
MKRKEEKMKSKYCNDAIIGGKNITASYSKTGELLRVMYPTQTLEVGLMNF